MYNPKIHHRRTIRIKDYDYSNEGMYFITICTKNRVKILGNIVNSKIKLSKIGHIVESELERSNKINNNSKIYDYTIMPNHMHMIIEINYDYKEKLFNTKLDRAQSCAPTEGKGKAIGKVVRGIKSSISSKIGKSIWQRNYYEHVIRNEKELYKIQEYIQNNPINWEFDENNI